MLVVGPAGIGKTTLVASALDGVPHAAGTAIGALRWKPYLPLAGAIGDDLEGDPDRVAATVAGSLDGRVLVVEDLHHADPATLDALAALVRLVPVVATTRPPAAGAPDPAAPVRSLADVVELGPLPRDSCRALARRWHPDLEPSRRRELVELAAGNPLLLQFLARDGRVTPTLRAAAAARLAALTLEVRHAVTQLAVFGQPLDPRVLVVPGTALPPELVRIEDGRVALGHGLLADAAIAAATDRELAAARRDLAERLPPAAAAEQFLRAGDPAAAAQAGRAALAEVADPAERAHLLGVVASATGCARDRVEAAAALCNVGAWRDAVRHGSAVGDDDAATAIAAAYHVARSSWYLGDFAGAAAACARGLAHDGASAPSERARLLVEQAQQQVRLAGPSGNAVPIAEAALDAAIAAGVDVVKARLALATAMAHDNVDGWEDAFAEVMTAGRDDDPESAGAAGYFLGSRLSMSGRLREADAVLRRAAAAASTHGSTTWTTHIDAAAITVRFQTGEPSREVLEAAKAFRAAHPAFRNLYQVETVAALCLADAERFDAAERLLDEALAHATGDDERSMLLSAATEVAWLAGDHDAALRWAPEAERHHPGFFGIAASATAAAAYARFELGEPAVLVAPAAQAAAYALFANDVAALNRLASGDPAGALSSLDAAAAAWARLPIPRWELRSRWAAGELAVRLGDASARRRLVEVARRAADAGLQPLAARAERSLAATGPQLTPAERRVMDLVADGCTSVAAATRLGVSRATVETHVRAAMRKLGAATRVQAVARYRGHIDA